MKTNVLKIITAVIISVEALMADDLRKDISMEEAVEMSSGIYIAYPVSENDETVKSRLILITALIINSEDGL